MEALVLKLMWRHVALFEVKFVRFNLVFNLPQNLIECWCQSLHVTTRSLRAPSSLLDLLNLACHKHMQEQTVLMQELRVHRLDLFF